MLSLWSVLYRSSFSDCIGKETESDDDCFCFYSLSLDCVGCLMRLHYVACVGEENFSIVDGVELQGWLVSYCRCSQITHCRLSVSGLFG